MEMVSVQVFFFDLGFDGVQLLNNYTVNFLVIRSRDAAPNISSKAENAATFMIIPGPRDPKCGWDVFNAIYLEAFVALGIHSGVHVHACMSVTFHPVRGIPYRHS